MKSSKPPYCGYCGGSSQITSEHVVPRCFFGAKPPPNLLTIPACKRCNGQKSDDDAFLRDYLTSDIEGHENPTAQAIFGGKVERSIRKNRSEFANVVRQGRKSKVALQTRAGIYLGEALRVSLPDGRVASILFQVARGLYFSSRKAVLPKTIPYEALRHAADVWARFAAASMNSPRVIIGSVFDCAFTMDPKDASTTLWIMRFYGSVVFSVKTGVF